MKVLICLALHAAPLFAPACTLHFLFFFFSWAAMSFRLGRRWGGIAWNFCICLASALSFSSSPVAPPSFGLFW